MYALLGMFCTVPIQLLFDFISHYARLLSLLPDADESWSLCKITQFKECQFPAPEKKQWGHLPRCLMSAWEVTLPGTASNP